MSEGHAMDRLIWIDLEMSGLLPDKDRILEVAMILTDDKLKVVAESPSWAVRQTPELLEGMDEWNRRTHEKSGLMKRCLESSLDEKAVEELSLDFLREHKVPEGKSPMCGNSICQDRRFLYAHMPRFEAFFHYRNFDVSSVKMAAQLKDPKLMFHKRAAHTAAADIRESIDEMQYYLRHMLSDGAGD